MPIEKIRARQILDSQGEPTIEVDLITDIGVLRSSVSSTYISDTNQNETQELRDNNENYYNGKSVLKAIDNINKIIGPELVKSRLEVCQQREIDMLMLRLDNDKTKLGSNAILCVSISCCKAGAIKKCLPLYKYIGQLADNKNYIIPVPIFSIISGGILSNNTLSFKDFMIMPIGAKTFNEAMEMGCKIYKIVENIIAELQEIKPPLGISCNGSFMPDLEDNNEAISIINDAIKSSGYDDKIKISIDISASDFTKDGQYDLSFKTDDSDPDDYIDSETLIEQYNELINEFPSIVSIEDPFDMEDWDSWPTLIEQSSIQIVANDLTSMNYERIEETIDRQAANSLTIKLSQIGTITETIDCYKLAKKNGLSIIVCAGYGETEDNFLSDFVIGLSAGQFKAGSPCRGERILKYNHIIRIEEELGKNCIYAGEMYRNPLKLYDNIDDDNDDDDNNNDNKKKIKKKKNKKKKK